MFSQRIKLVDEDEGGHASFRKDWGVRLSINRKSRDYKLADDDCMSHFDGGQLADDDSEQKDQTGSSGLFDSSDTPQPSNSDNNVEAQTTPSDAYKAKDVRTELTERTISTQDSSASSMDPATSLFHNSEASLSFFEPQDNSNTEALASNCDSRTSFFQEDGGDYKEPLKQPMEDFDAGFTGEMDLNESFATFQDETDFHTQSFPTVPQTPASLPARPTFRGSSPSRSLRQVAAAMDDAKDSPGTTASAPALPCRRKSQGASKSRTIDPSKSTPTGKEKSHSLRSFRTTITPPGGRRGVNRTRSLQERTSAAGPLGEFLDHPSASDDDAPAGNNEVGSGDSDLPKSSHAVNGGDRPIPKRKSSGKDRKLLKPPASPGSQSESSRRHSGSGASTKRTGSRKSRPSLDKVVGTVVHPSLEAPETPQSAATKGSIRSARGSITLQPKRRSRPSSQDGLRTPRPSSKPSNQKPVAPNSAPARTQKMRMAALVTPDKRSSMLAASKGHVSDRGWAACDDLLDSPSSLQDKVKENRRRGNKQAGGNLGASMDTFEVDDDWDWDASEVAPTVVPKTKTGKKERSSGSKKVPTRQSLKSTKDRKTFSTRSLDAPEDIEMDHNASYASDLGAFLQDTTATGAEAESCFAVQSSEHNDARGKTRLSRNASLPVPNRRQSSKSDLEAAPKSGNGAVVITTRKPKLEVSRPSPRSKRQSKAQRKGAVRDSLMNFLDSEDDSRLNF